MTAENSQARLRRAMAALGIHDLRSNPSQSDVIDLYVITRHDATEIKVALHRAPVNLYAAQVGFLRAERLDGVDEFSESTCEAALNRLRRKTGSDLWSPYVVLESNLAESLQGLGLGAWMYGEATRLAGLHGEALTASTCFGGQTSLAASMVWLGASFRRVAHVEDMAAVWKGGAEMTVPAGVRLRPYGAWKDDASMPPTGSISSVSARA